MAELTAPTTLVAPAAPRSFALTRNHILRYVAAVGGLVALIGFYQPWVRADLNGIGAMPLSGIELARNDASTRVDNALFGGRTSAGVVSGSPGGAAGSSGASGAGSASSASSASGTGGLVLPTRQPTAVTASQGASQVISGLTLPTRVPTAAVFFDVAVVGSTVNNINFGSTANGIIRGSVFADENGNGRRDSGDRGLAGWTVFIDKDNDGRLDRNEKSRLTDSNGAYRFAGLPAGTYRVRVVQQPGFRATIPAAGVRSVPLAAGQSLSNRNFGQDQV